MLANIIFLGTLLIPSIVAQTSWLGSSSGLVSARRSRHRVAARSTTWKYLGCTRDSSGNRLLTSYGTNSNSLTIESCVATCSGMGYTYAGLEFYTQCFCGNQLAYPISAVPDSSCNAKCSGSSTEMCGGVNLISVYQAPASSSPPATALGCYVDSSTRLLNGPSTNAKTSASPALCASWCFNQGYAFAGVEFYGQCFCGNTTPPAAAVAPAAECNTPCSAATSEMCGGAYRINVYQLKAAPPATIATYTGTATSTTSKPVSQSTTTKASSTSKAASSTSKASSTMTSTSKASSISSTAHGVTSSIGSTVKSTSSALSSKPATGSVTASITASVTGNGTSAAPTGSYPAGCNAACAVVTGVTAPASSKGSNALYAHVMMGNTYSYSAGDWASQVGLAQGANIDGFALNLGGDSWETTEAAYAYGAAEAAGFEIFFSFDFTSMSCSSAADASKVSGLITQYASSRAQVKHVNASLVSSFSGDGCTFGQSSVLAGWTFVRSLLAASNETMYLVPAIFSDPSTFDSASMAWLDGEFNWNSGWPTGGSDLTTASDQQYMAGLAGKSYMAAISPCFFTYYGPNSWNKDWIYRSDDWLIAARMEQLIGMRDQINMAEIISWNDFGESHYIGPVAPASDQPMSTGWTDGMPHTPWLSLIAYYAQAFKTGSYPSPTDGIWLWSRPHSAGATASSPSNPKPTGWQNTDDNVYAVVILSAPATVTLTSGTNHATWSLNKGLNKLKLANAPGGIGASIARGGLTVKSYSSVSAGFSWVETPVDYNFNYFVASA